VRWTLIRPNSSARSRKRVVRSSIRSLLPRPLLL